MAQEREAKAKDQNTQHDHIGDDEVSELQRPPNFYQKVQELAERFACTRLGQFTIERADRVLKLIEDTTKWSLPQEKSPNTVVLERPLPWAPFLLLIIMLRLARIWLSVGALMIGNGPVSPSDMIYFIQTRRRKLRAIRVHGLKVMRHRHQESSSSGRKGVTQKLSVWLSRAICRPGVQRANSGRLFKVEQPQPTQSVAKRPREEDEKVEQDHNMTIDEMLNKYANENSEDDSDFVPNAEDESQSSSSESESNSGDETSSNQEEEDNLEKYKSNNGVLNHKTESHLDKQKQQGQEQNTDMDKHKEKLAKTTTSNGSNDKPQTEVALRLDALKQEEWHSTPEPKSAALLKTPLYNNAVAAANTNQLQSKPVSILSTSQPVKVPEPNNVNENDTDTDTDTETNTDTDITINSESATDQQIHSTIETLTPATSSEDIFYSPIGSPNNFNSCFESITPLSNVTIKTVATHSTPNSDVDYVNSPASQLAESTRLSISLAHQGLITDTPPHPQQPQPQPQPQPQRYRQHNSHRFRGRNRR